MNTDEQATIDAYVKQTGAAVAYSDMAVAEFIPLSPKK
jgi:hypothetical protein